ncbi:MAG: replicative DNA helicase [Flavobacterium sp.]|uniref:replicative DNA helicase n=1 Tax=Flavobacterium sp. TaxID=239 RepID=UPI000C4FF8B0|nr:replicative DNA helicase [Flavobacterium sp.]MBF05003.1 replicative DNA helicase [Flavobacterium sp.]|tara:strand:+ start:396 stop:1889 length:1494 start_codon:yes stop_codon:yes gene_type:complete
MNQTKSNIIEINRGLIPPQAVDIEEAVLGAAMVDHSGIDDLMMVIKDQNVFYKEPHVFIYAAIKSLFENGSPIDLITVSQKLKSLGTLEAVGGDFYLISLTQKVSSSAHMEYWCRILLQKYIARQIIKFNSQTTALAYSEETDIFELMGKLQMQFDEISNIGINGRKAKSFSENLKDLSHRIEHLSTQQENNELVGIPTGFKRVDRFTGGYHPQELIILAARPGMGKTALILKTAVANAKVDNAVGIISLEMAAMQLTARVVAIDTDFHLSQLIKTGFDKQKYFESYSRHSHRMGKYPIYIDDASESDINSIILKARYWKRKYDIKVLIIDYLQLMKDTSVNGNREQEISSISRRLKMLSKELEIPVIAISQLSRAVETRASSKRPLLSDLRESGAIEQDADIIQFLYRPEYYKIDINDNEEYEDMVNDGANTEFIFAKYRSGSVATTYLKWIGDKTKFVDPTDDNENFEPNPEGYELNNELPKPSLNEAFGDDNPF